MVVLRQPLDAKAARAAAGAPARVIKQQAQRRRRRAGVVIPLFSIRSQTGWGLGEIPDLPARRLGGAGGLLGAADPAGQRRVRASTRARTRRPRAFALDPVYLGLDACEDFIAAGGRDALPDGLPEQPAAAATAPLVDWPVVRTLKRAGVALAFQRFLRDEWQKQTGRARQLSAFMRANRDWLDDYALFAVLHAKFGAGWLDWPIGARDRDPGTDRRRSGASTPMSCCASSGCSGSSICSGARPGARRAPPASI